MSLQDTTLKNDFKKAFNEILTDANVLLILLVNGAKNGTSLVVGKNLSMIRPLSNDK